MLNSSDASVCFIYSVCNSIVCGLINECVACVILRYQNIKQHSQITCATLKSAYQPNTCVVTKTDQKEKSFTLNQKIIT